MTARGKEPVKALPPDKRGGSITLRGRVSQSSGTLAVALLKAVVEGGKDMVEKEHNHNRRKTDMAVEPAIHSFLICRTSPSFDDIKSFFCDRIKEVSLFFGQFLHIIDCGVSV